MDAYGVVFPCSFCWEKIFAYELSQLDEFHCLGLRIVVISGYIFSRFVNCTVFSPNRTFLRYKALLSVVLNSMNVSKKFS